MQVSVEELGGLERRMTVQVPADRIDPEVKNRLTTLSRKARLDGFRPGKVPYKIIKRMYGSQVRQEVMGEVLQQSYQDALTQQNLRPAGRPTIEPKKMDEGEDLEYSATFEVFPEFKVKGLDELKVERPVAEVTEADIDAMIETLRKQRATWNKVDRPAREDDQLTLDFEGKIDGEDFPDNKGEGVALELGAGNMLKEFEEKLIGLTSGTETAFDVTFPGDYHVKDIAGKTAYFTVKIDAVSEPILPDIDEEFAASFDIKEGSVESLRQAIRENMERELKSGIKSHVKRQLMQNLLEANDIPLPQTMIKAQVQELTVQIGLGEQAESDEEVAKLKADLFEPEARRRVALGLIVSRLALDNNIQVDENKVRDHLLSAASTYQDSAAVIQWYSQNPQAMDNIRVQVLEDQIVDWLLDHAQVTDKPSSFHEVMHPHHGHGHEHGHDHEHSHEQEHKHEHDASQE